MARRWTLGCGGVLALGVATLAVGFLANPPVRAVPATVADDPSLPSLTLDGVVFHAETHGDPDAPPVVVIHGGPGGDYKNLLVLKALADDYHVLFYDQRGTGLSPRVPAEELTFDSSIEDVHRVVEHHGGGEPVALIGHSWGAMLAAYYLAAHPDKVARAVLAEPGVLSTEELRSFMALMQPTLSPATLLYMAGAGIQTLRVSGPDDAARADYMVEQVMTMPGEGNAMNHYWCGGEAPEAAHDTWRVGATAMQAVNSSAMQDDGELHMPLLDASGYAGEVLLVAGGCNTVIGEALQREHLPLFPNARLEVVADAGHLMFTDQPEASLGMLRDYLGDWPVPEAPDWGLALGMVGVGGTGGRIPTVDGAWEDVRVDGPLGPTHVGATLDREGGVFRMCALAAAMSDTPDGGTVTAAFEVGIDGVVGDVTVDGGEGLARCVADHLRRGRFHPPGAGSRVTARFVWSSRP